MNQPVPVSPLSRFRSTDELLRVGAYAKKMRWQVTASARARFDISTFSCFAKKVIGLGAGLIGHLAISDSLVVSEYAGWTGVISTPGQSPQVANRRPCIRPLNAAQFGASTLGRAMKTKHLMAKVY